MPDYPSWDGLIAELCAACDIERADSDTDDPLVLADIAKRKDRKLYEQTLKNQFKRKEIYKNNTICRYHLLARIKFASYVTTNFDPLLLT